MDPMVSRLAGELSALRAEVAALRRSQPSGTGVSTAFGATSVRTMQTGFAAQLISPYGSATGYDWKRLELNVATPGFVNPAVQLKGNRAFTVDDDQTLASGTLGWLEIDDTSTGYVFTPIGGDSDLLLVEVTVSGTSHTVKRKTYSGGAVIDYSPATTYTAARSTISGETLPVGTIAYLNPIPDVAGNYWISRDANSQIGRPDEGDVSYYRHTESNTSLGTYAPGGVITGNSVLNVSVAAGRMHVVALVVPQRITLDRLGINVAVAAAATNKARLAIYDTAAGGKDLWPRTLLVDTGEFLVDSTGSKIQTISLTLRPGLYWICYNGQAVTSLTGTTDVFMWPIFGVSNTLVQYFGLQFSYAYAAFPASFPAKDPLYLANGSFAIPYVRIAS